MLTNADRVKETTTTTGTGTYSLAGALAGFRTFVAGIGTTNLCNYVVEDGTNWECGIGTVTSGSPDTLARTAILSSSNAGAAVNWGAGTKNVFCSPVARSGVGVVRVGASALGVAGNSIIVTAPVGLTRLWGHAFVKAPGALVPRLLLGSISAIDATANYSQSVALDNANPVTTVSFTGWNLIVAALASGNRTYIEFSIIKSAAAEMARGLFRSAGISSAITVAPTHAAGTGLWGNTADLLGKVELHGYSAITGTTNANMDVGSELVVYGSYEE